MNKQEIKKVNKCIEDLHSHDDEIKKIEKEIFDIIDPFCDFEIGVTKCSDGFVLIDEKANVADFKSCIDIIREKGILSQEDFYSCSF